MLLQKLDTNSVENLTSAGFKPPRIYVTNWAGHDFTPALDFTNLPAESAFVAITNGDANILRPDRLTYQIRTRLQGFLEEDYLLVCGHPLLFGLALHTLLRRLPGVKILQWNARTRTYWASYVSSTGFSLPLDPNLDNAQCVLARGTKTNS